MNIYWVDWRKLPDIVMCIKCDKHMKSYGEGWYAHGDSLWCPPCWIKTEFKIWENTLDSTGT